MGDEASYQAFLRACAAGQMAKVEEGLRKGVDPSLNYNWALRKAAASGRVQVAARLLEDARVDPGDVNSKALGVASFYGHMDVVVLLLSDARTHAGAGDAYALRVARQTGHRDIALLLERQMRADELE